MRRILSFSAQHAAAVAAASGGTAFLTIPPGETFHEVRITGLTLAKEKKPSRPGSFQINPIALAVRLAGGGA